jgi:hypothetical protein
MMTYGFFWETLIFIGVLKTETSLEPISMISLCLIILSAIWVLLNYLSRVEVTHGAICRIPPFWNKLTGFLLLWLGPLSSL